MKEAKDLKFGASSANDSGTESSSRKEEATSSETLSEVEATRSRSERESAAAGEVESSSVPSPDGTASVSQSGRTDSADAGEPM